MAKPVSKIDWTVNNPTPGLVRAEPTAQEKKDGWFADQRPPMEFLNWVFWNIWLWLEYFETTTDNLVALQNTYDAVIAPTGTHADINAVMADADTIAGLIKRVLVMTPQVPLVTQIINQPDMHFEFKPQATFTDGADLATGLEIDSPRVTIIYGRFSGFDDAPGDEAIKLTANAKNCLISNNRFFDNNNTINDLGAGNVLANNIDEV